MWTIRACVTLDITDEEFDDAVAAMRRQGYGTMGVVDDWRDRLEYHMGQAAKEELARLIVTGEKAREARRLAASGEIEIGRAPHEG